MEEKNTYLSGVIAHQHETQRINEKLREQLTQKRAQYAGEIKMIDEALDALGMVIKPPQAEAPEVLSPTALRAVARETIEHHVRGYGIRRDVLLEAMLVNVAQLTAATGAVLERAEDAQEHLDLLVQNYVDSGVFEAYEGAAGGDFVRRLPPKPTSLTADEVKADILECLRAHGSAGRDGLYARVVNRTTSDAFEDALAALVCSGEVVRPARTGVYLLAPQRKKPVADAARAVASKAKKRTR